MARDTQRTRGCPLLVAALLSRRRCITDVYSVGVRGVRTRCYIIVQFPGTDRGQGFPEVDYAEELLMGYRWYDTQVRILDVEGRVGAWCIKPTMDLFRLLITGDNPRVPLRTRSVVCDVFIFRVSHVF